MKCRLNITCKQCKKMSRCDLIREIARLNRLVTDLECKIVATKVKGFDAMVRR